MPIEREMISVDGLSREEYGALARKRNVNQPEREPDYFYEEILEDSDLYGKKAIAVRKVINFSRSGPSEQQNLHAPSIAEIIEERKWQKEMLRKGRLRQQLDDEVSDLLKSDRASYSYLPQKISDLADHQGKDLNVLIKALQLIRMKNITRWEKAFDAAIAKLENEEETIKNGLERQRLKDQVLKAEQLDWKRLSVHYEGEIQEGKKEKPDLMGMTLFARSLIKDGFDKKAEFPMGEWKRRDI